MGTFSNVFSQQSAWSISPHVHFRTTKVATLEWDTCCLAFTLLGKYTEKCVSTNNHLKEPIMYASVWISCMPLPSANKIAHWGFEA